MPRRLTLAVAPLLLALALAGCTESTRLPPPEPPAAGEPLFASDEEALAAATAAYEEYLAVSNAVTGDPQSSIAQLESKTTPTYFESVSDSVSQLREQGLKSSGTTEIAKVALQQHSESESEVLVVLYLCLDVSGTRLIDSGGNDVTPVDRRDLVPLEVTFVSEVSVPNLLLDESEVWPEGAICD